MFGFLNIDKPAGITSRDAVNRVQRLVRPVKVGHAGTLDPLATGVLVVAVGPATRLIEYAQRAPKRYRGEFLLGRESETEDVEGNVIELPDPPHPSRAEIEAVLPNFVGRIQQRPPAFSALKVKGRRAHEIARQGQAVELAARPVDVFSMQLLQYDYPRLVLEVACGAGTYIRSLGRDIARALGTGAVMSALVRLAVGEFELADARPLEALSAETIAANLRSPLSVLKHLPQVTLKPSDLERIACGLTIRLDDDFGDGEVVAVDEQGRLRAILTQRPPGWGPSRNFPPE